MKKYLLILLLGMSSHCYSCGSNNEDGIVDVSQDNNLGVSAEILSEGQILITLPKKFKEGDTYSVTLLIGDYENSEPINGVRAVDQINGVRIKVSNQRGQSC